MLKKITASLLASLMLLSILAAVGCASTGKSDFEKQLEQQEKQKQMEMNK